ncbi:hypothetical protein KZ773_26955 [Escherichia coli]|nr:hypothetical protein [Escherichia coli]
MPVCRGHPATAGVVRHQRSEWCGQKPVNDMLYIKRRSLRHVNLPGGRCYQRACLSGQGQGEYHSSPPSARLSLAKNDPGIGGGDGRSVKQADGRVKLKLSPSTRSVFRKTCPRAGRRQRGVMCMLYIRGDIPAYG